MDFLFDPFQEESPESAARMLGETPATLGERMAGLIYRQPTRLPLEASERAAYDPEATGWRAYLAGNIDAMGGSITPDDLRAPATPLISPQETKQYSPDGEPLSDHPIPQGLAQVLGRQKADRITADSAIRRFGAGHSWPVNLATELAASVTDPLNVASMFVPFFGEESIALRLGLGSSLIARTGARAIAGYGLGVGTQLPISTMEAALDPDYGIHNFLYDTFVQAPLNAAIPVIGFGALREGFRYLRGLPSSYYVHPEARAVIGAGPQVSAKAMGSAIAQTVEGREVDVGGFFDRPQSIETAEGHLPGKRPEPGPIDDIDRMARQIDPVTFKAFDTLATQHEAMAEQLRQPNAGALFDQLTAAETEIATLKKRAETARPRDQRALGERISRLEDSLIPLEGRPEALDVASVRQEMQRVDYQMRDLATAVTAAYDEARRRAEVPGIAPQAERQAGRPAGVPFMITAAMKQRLRTLGYSDAAIREMTPAEANRVLGSAREPPDVAGQADRANTVLQNGYAPGMAPTRLADATEAVMQRPAAPGRPEPKPPTDLANWQREIAPRETPARAGAAPAAAREADIQRALRMIGEEPTLDLAKLAPEISGPLLAAQEAAERAARLDPELAEAERAFANIDKSLLLPEERAELAKTETELNMAAAREGAYFEAADCLVQAGEG
jgi:hypothetical protein